MAIQHDTCGQFNVTSSAPAAAIQHELWQPSQMEHAHCFTDRQGRGSAAQKYLDIEFDDKDWDNTDNNTRQHFKESVLRILHKYFLVESEVCG